MNKTPAPKPQLDPEDEEDDIAEKTRQVCLTTTIYKEDVRLIITESAKATPSKM